MNFRAGTVFFLILYLIAHNTAQGVKLIDYRFWRNVRTDDPEFPRTSMRLVATQTLTVGAIRHYLAERHNLATQQILISNKRVVPDWRAPEWLTFFDNIYDRTVYDPVPAAVYADPLAYQRLWWAPQDYFMSLIRGGIASLLIQNRRLYNNQNFVPGPHNEDGDLTWEERMRLINHNRDLAIRMRQFIADYGTGT